LANSAALSPRRMRAEAGTGSAVLDVWSHVEPRFGGVGPAASAMATAVERSGMRVNQIAICDGVEQELADGIDPCVTRICGSRLRGWADLQLANALQHAINGSDVCHVHGMWLPHCLAVRRIANQMGKPVVSSVHGMLEQWEMRHKWLKKSTYSWLLERPSLARSACLRALSEREVGDYRRYGSRAPVALVPNGIEPLERVNRAAFLERFPELKDKSIVLFLGRVHHKKGVFNLVRAWKTVSEQRDDAHLVIAGPEYGDTGEKARRLIAELHLERAVTIAGVLSGPPVITPECNMPCVAARGAGRVTSNEPAALADTLISCLDSSAGEWREMGCAAQNLARSDFDWNKIGCTMRSVYEWLLGGNKPACVEE